MKPFSLDLPNGATLTGLSNIPEHSPTKPKHRPLMVGLHGGSYSSAYFHVDDHHTAALASNALDVPWVAVDRPGYKGSTGATIPDDSSFPETMGELFHKFILPTLWKTFGEPNGCNSIVLHGHSLGSPISVIAAALSAQDAEAAYPLSGVTFSGFGIHLIPGAGPPVEGELPEFFEFDPAVKDGIMIPEGTCDPSVYKHAERLNTRFLFREVADIHAAWLPRPEAWIPRVKVPILFALAERDSYWQPDDAHVKALIDSFSSSPRVEGGVMQGAPHNLEMSYWAPGWYSRVFGFGLECAAGFAAVAVAEKKSASAAT